jgi:hypothetical protein
MLFFCCADGVTDRVVDVVDGLCLSPSNYTIPVDVPQHHQPPGMTGLDDFETRQVPIDDGRYRWTVRIEY